MEYKKINKQKARRLYEEGKTIYLLPCKVRLNNLWIVPFPINKKDGSLFDRCVDYYEYYNCQYNETGKYSAYYIEKEV